MILLDFEIPLDIIEYLSLLLMVATDRMSLVRGVAQWISAPAWGAGGRPFKSDRPDLSLR